MGTTGIIAELCRHEWLRARRDAHFRRNCLIWFLQSALWCSIAFSLPYALESMDMAAAAHLPLLLCLDQVIRLVSQRTPDIPTLRYSLLPVRRRQVLAAYLVRMAFVPATLVWVPTLWRQWWLLGLFVISGYVYLALWHGYRHLIAGGTGKVLMTRTNGLLACEMKMRMRVPSLRHKIRNGLLASLLLLAVSLVMRNDIYTDFMVMYTLLFPSLPLLTSRLGYEQDYMGLLSTRLHSMAPIYRAKYVAALLLLLPSAALLAIPVACGLLTVWRLLAWTLGTAAVIYPALLYAAPQCKPDSPSAQMLTLAAFTLPVLLVNACLA